MAVTETLKSRIDITRFRNTNLFLNTTAWIFRLYLTYKANNKLKENFVTIHERKCALTFWIKDAQRDRYQISGVYENTSSNK